MRYYEHTVLIRSSILLMKGLICISIDSSQNMQTSNEVVVKDIFSHEEGCRLPLLSCFPTFPRHISCLNENKKVIWWSTYHALWVWIWKQQYFPKGPNCSNQIQSNVHICKHSRAKTSVYYTTCTAFKAGLVILIWGGTKSNKYVAQ